jgi:hypothetical protein
VRKRFTDGCEQQWKDSFTGSGKKTFTEHNSKDRLKGDGNEQQMKDRLTGSGE